MNHWTWAHWFVVSWLAVLLVIIIILSLGWILPRNKRDA